MTKKAKELQSAIYIYVDDTLASGNAEIEEIAGKSLRHLNQ